MPSCPICETDYPAGTVVCPKDGARLSAVVAGGAAGIGGGGGAARAALAADIASAPTLPEEPTAAAATSAAAESFDPLVGASLAGRYLVVRRIGEGGMGAVYEAKHTLIGKRVAVKVLLE